MKILHICLCSFFPDNYSYQENLLPKYHKINGHHVEVIASLQTFDKFGKVSYLPKSETYFNEYNIKVTRLDYKKPDFIYKKLKSYKFVYENIEKFNPEIIFVHGGQFLDIRVVRKYVKKNPNVKLYIDNHADFSNSARSWISKNILHKILWRFLLKSIEPYTIKFYGVMPVRVSFLIDIYKLPKDKCDLLVMGADDEVLKKIDTFSNRQIIRKTYNINSNDFLVVFGGKIDEFKKQVLILMDAINMIDSIDIVLLIFGSISKQLKNEFDSRLSKRIKYIGWINSIESYKIFDSSDLVCFPGRHSVFWEQVVGQGIPMLVKYWPGMEHLDLNGNLKYLYEDSSEEIVKKIIQISEKTEYKKMKKIAESEGKKLFSYSHISCKSIEHTAKEMRKINDEK
ncbi:MAG: hypothetical protein RBQ97_02850 [Acholeplasma sp.]|nr:hypothetical protein [Acholeplasma sp.]